MGLFLFKGDRTITYRNRIYTIVENNKPLQENEIIYEKDVFINSRIINIICGYFFTNEDVIYDNSLGKNMPLDNNNIIEVDGKIASYNPYIHIPHIKYTKSNNSVILQFFTKVKPGYTLIKGKYYYNLEEFISPNKNFSNKEYANDILEKYLTPDVDKFFSISRFIDLHTKANRDNPMVAIASNLYNNLDVSNTEYNLLPWERLLSDFTYGFEFETSSCNLAPHDIRLGLVPVKDGSITGLEVCTLPLSGYKGIHCLINICKALSNTCKVDIRCSLHLNLSCWYLDKKDYIVNLYTLYSLIQDDIVSFLPSYIKNPVAIAKKDKMYADYIPRLPAYNTDSNIEEYINKSYQILFELYTGFSSVNKSKFKSWENRTWLTSSRYFSLNLMPFFTGSKKSKRIEFRIHPPTTNIYRTLIWLAICTCIMRYAHKHNVIYYRAQKRKITLLDILVDIRDDRESTVGCAQIIDFIIAYIKHHMELNFCNELFATSVANAKDGGLYAKNRVLVDMAESQFKKDPTYIPQLELNFNLLNEI